MDYLVCIKAECLAEVASMNNVLNRKMFVNRDARAKLANMGGILQSSPEMANITQKFAPGGTVGQQVSDGRTGSFKPVSDGRTGSFKPDPSFMDRLFESLMVKVRNNEPFTKQESEIFEEIASQDDQLRDSIIASRDQGAAMGEFGAAGAIGDIPDRTEIPPESFSQAVTDQTGGDNSLEGITGTEAYRFIRGDTDSEGFIDSLMPPVEEEQERFYGPVVRPKGIMQSALDNMENDPRGAGDGFGSDLLSQEMLDAEKARADQSGMRLSTGDSEASSSYLGQSSEVRKDPQEVISRDQRIAGEDMAFAQDVPQGQPRYFAPQASDPRSASDGFGSDLLASQEMLDAKLPRINVNSAKNLDRTDDARAKRSASREAGVNDSKSILDPIKAASASVSNFASGILNPESSDPRSESDGFGSDLLASQEILDTESSSMFEGDLHIPSGLNLEEMDLDQLKLLVNNITGGSDSVKVQEEIKKRTQQNFERLQKIANDEIVNTGAVTDDTLTEINDANDQIVIQEKIGTTIKEENLNPALTSKEYNIQKILARGEAKKDEYESLGLNTDRIKMETKEKSFQKIPQKKKVEEKQKIVEPKAFVPSKIIKKISENKTGDITGDITTGVLDAGGIDSSNMTLSQKVAAQRKMYSDILGTDTDVDKKEQFWMNMAMVGFQIASGESPDALTNISKGLLSFAMQTKEDDKTRRSRQDKFGLLALQDEIARENDTMKFDRDVRLANIKASNKSLYGLRKDPTTQLFATAKELFQDGLGEYDTYEAAIEGARKIIEKEYNLSGAETKDLVDNAPEATGAQHKAANEAAIKNNKKNYFLNGVEYNVQ